jgi:hypothetical protein
MKESTKKTRTALGGSFGKEDEMAAVMEKNANKDSRQSQDKARVQFDFSKDSLAKLDEIVKTVDASTRAEVIRRALTLYTEVLEAEKRGAKIFFRDPDGTLIQVMPLF